MEEEFKRIYDCMRASETVADGEYFVIHADHLHDFEMAIGHYFDENKLIEKIKNYTANVGKIDDSNIERYIHILFEQQSEIIHKLDEIINKINRLGV